MNTRYAPTEERLSTLMQLATELNVLHVSAVYQRMGISRSRARQLLEIATERGWLNKELVPYGRFGISQYWITSKGWGQAITETVRDRRNVQFKDRRGCYWKMLFSGMHGHMPIIALVEHGPSLLTQGKHRETFYASDEWVAHYITKQEFEWVGVGTEPTLRLEYWDE